MGKDKLKPCPFCGCKDILAEPFYPYWIICEECGAKIRGYNQGIGLNSMAASREAWNRRSKGRRKKNENSN